jgi:hypothetical protein
MEGFGVTCAAISDDRAVHERRLRLARRSSRICPNRARRQRRPRGRSPIATR